MTILDVRGNTEFSSGDSIMRKAEADKNTQMVLVSFVYKPFTVAPLIFQTAFSKRLYNRAIQF